jgi:hypothetical protein
VSIYNVKNFPGAKPPDPRDNKRIEGNGEEGREWREEGKGKGKEGKGAEQREGDRNSLP